MEPVEEDSKGLKKEALDACETLLASHPVFASLNSALLERLAALFTEKTYQAEEVIVTEGDYVDFIGLIVEGSAEVRRSTASESGTSSVPIAVLHQYEAIGLSDTGFYSKTGKRTATVIALSPVTLYSLAISDLNKFIEAYPALTNFLEDSSQIILRMSLIKKSTPFAELSIEKLHWLAQHVTEKTVSTGKVLFKQGDQASECYILVKGQIEILLKDQKTSHSLAVLTPPAIFGEAALLTEAPRNATAQTLAPCKLFVLNREYLFEVIGSEKNAQEALLALMSLRERPYQQLGIEHYSQQSADGEEIITLKNPSTLKYFRLSEAGWFVWQKLDGKHTLRDITMALLTEFQLFNPGLVSNLIAELDQAGFIMRQKTKLQKEETILPPWVKILLMIKHIMEFKWAFSNVDSWITTSFNKVIKFLYTRVGLACAAVIALAGFIVFILHFHQGIALMKSTKGSGWLFFATVPILMIMMITHELAHGYTTKAFGRTVHAFGLGWLWFGPIAFCDTSDMWLCSRSQRIAVDLAGFGIQLVWAGLASLIMLFINAPTLELLLWYFALFNYLVIFQNLTPIVELDGYYTLMDLLDTPNLKAESVNWLVNIFPTIWRTPKAWFAYKPELIYWILCFIFLMLEFVIPYVVLQYLLVGLFGKTNLLMSLLISLAVVAGSVLTIWADIRRKRLETTA